MDVLGKRVVDVAYQGVHRQQLMSYKQGRTQQYVIRTRRCPMSASSRTPQPESSHQYEFTPEQSETIKSLAGEMRWVAFPLIIIGGLYLLSGFAHIAIALQNRQLILPIIFIGLGAALYLALGIWTKRSAESFTQVTSTAGNDIAHLMSALDNLRKAYSLLALFVKLYVAFLILTMIVALIMWLTGNLPA
jgi:hypothetical protein